MFEKMRGGNVYIFAITLLMCAYVSAHSYQSPYQQIKMQHLTYPTDEASGAYITVSPNKLKQSGDWIVVKYSAPNPSNDDWIGVFSPSTVDISTSSPVKYQLANFSQDYIQNGWGFQKFSIVNMHSDVVLVLFRNGTQHPVFAAKSEVITFENPEEPLQGHIALTQNQREIRVMWNTGYNVGQQYVKYGTSSNSYTHTVLAGESVTYTPNDLCGSPAKDYGWKNPGLLHNAVLKNLIPGTRYYYRYGSELSGISEELQFVAPRIPSPSQEISVFAFGDMGKAEVDDALEHWEEIPSLKTTRHMIELRDELDLVLHIGDISYAVGYSAQWDRFMEQIKPIASRVPYMTLPGNHERDYPNSGSFFTGTDSGGECGVPYEQRFRMPTPGIDKLWYSFDMGPVHFVMMSTEHDFRKNSEQNAWIESDLKSVNRTNTPWIVFSGHRPMYIDSTNYSPDGGDQTVASLLRQSLEHMMVEYKVDVAFWGHHHSYQRTCHVSSEVCNNKVDSQSTVHVVIGMAGMGLSQNLETVKPKWIQYVDDQEYGYTRFWANATTFRMHYYGNDSGLKDQFILHK
jgi:hypothetical protein